MWILVIVVIKEFFMIAGASFLYGKEMVVSSKWYGKLTTVLFYLAIAFALLSSGFSGSICCTVVAGVTVSFWGTSRSWS